MSPESFPLLGPATCLFTAALWAGSVHLFRGPIEVHGARTINLLKCTLAALLQGLTVLVLGRLGELGDASTASLLWVATSGLVGLTLGDTALFAAVSRLGVQRTLLLHTFSPVFAAAAAFALLDERPGAAVFGGGGLILAGVALVVAPSRRALVPETWPLAGIGLALLAAAGQGVGLVMAKEGMREIAVLPASFLRLATAAAGLVALAAVAGRLRAAVAPLRERATMTRVAPATFFGTYLALFLMMAGIRWTPASVAAMLLATSPVAALFLERIVDGRPIRWREAVGTGLAVLGVGWVSAS